MDSIVSMYYICINKTIKLHNYETVNLSYYRFLFSYYFNQPLVVGTYLIKFKTKQNETVHSNTGTNFIFS